MTFWTFAVNLVWAAVVVYLVTFHSDRIKKIWDFIKSRDWKLQKGDLKLESLASQKAPEQLNSIPDNPSNNYTPIRFISDHAAKIGKEIERAASEFPNDKIKESFVAVLANTMFRENCEGIYNRIFESQIGALEELEKIGSITRSQALQNWKAFVASHSGFYREDDFDAWAQYLLNTNLVVIEGGLYSITPFGLEFLRYIRAQGLPRNRPL